MSSKTIDVQAGDTFTAFNNLWQHQANRSRAIYWGGENPWGKLDRTFGEDVPRDRAIAALRAMGYTIIEKDRHGREIVALNEVTGNYIAKKQGQEFCLLMNSDGSRVYDCDSGGWFAYPYTLGHLDEVSWYASALQKHLSTAPAYVAEPVKAEAGKVVRATMSPEWRELIGHLEYWSKRNGEKSIEMAARQLLSAKVNP